MKSNQKIMLSQLANIYTLDHLRFYQQDGQRLKFQIQDIQTIALFSQQQFIDYATKFRKNTLKYERNFKGFERHSQEMSQLAKSLKIYSNPDFSFKIHSLNNKNRIQRLPRNKILTELKLKFLQSQGVNEIDWQNWFIFEERVLLIKNISGDYKIKLQMDLDEQNNQESSELTWAIKDVLSYSMHNPHLFYFFKQYVAFAKKNIANWQRKLIQAVKTALLNIKAIEVFTELKRKQTVPTYNQNESIAYTIVVDKYEWKFNIYQRLQKPKCSLLINEQLKLDFQIEQNELWGQIYLDNQKSNILKNKERIILSSKQFLDKLGTKIYHFITLANKCLLKYPKINSIAKNVFMYLQNQIWKDENINISEDVVHLINSQGVWFVLEDKIIVKIQDDLSLTCNAAQNGYLQLLFQLNSLTIQNLILNLELRRSILMLNCQFQFKIYHMKLSPIRERAYFIYQFKSYKYMQNQRLFKLTEEEEKVLSIVNESNDGFVIIAKIRVDFQDVIFSVYKQKQGMSQESEIPDPYFSRQWRQYKKLVTGKYDYRNILCCIGYLCKYYLVDRSFNKRMHEQQQKMTRYHFK